MEKDATNVTCSPTYAPWMLDRAAFHAKVQATAPSDAVLRVKPHNINLYAQGSYSLVAKDLEVLANGAVESPLLIRLNKFFIKMGVPAAFEVRRELISLKKVLYHLAERGKIIETELRQSCCLFYDLDQNHPDKNLLQIAAPALGTCRGCVNTTRGARAITLAICNLPRHPEHPLRSPQKKVESLPSSINLFKLLRPIQKFISYFDRTKIPIEISNHIDRLTHGTDSMRVSPRSSSLPPTGQQILDSISEILRGKSWRLPVHVVDFVIGSLIARGAFKAFNIVRGVATYDSGLELAIAQILDAKKSLEMIGTHMRNLSDKGVNIHYSVNKKLVPNQSNPKQTRETSLDWFECTRQKNLRVTESMSASATTIQLALKDILRLGEKIRNESDSVAFNSIDKSPPTRLFVASDADAGAERGRSYPCFTPSTFNAGIPATLNNLDATVRNIRPKILKFLKVISTQTSKSKEDSLVVRPEGKKHKCATCRGSFGHLWVHRGMCYACERSCRENGMCPFASLAPVGSRKRDRCKDLFCVHKGQCLAHDMVLHCADCHFHRGDGEDVINIAMGSNGTRGTFAVFLDFDRTIASTRSGANPLVNSKGAHTGHTADAHLLALMSRHANVHIVTLNRHSDEIEKFLSIQLGGARKVGDGPRKQESHPFICQKQDNELSAGERIAMSGAGHEWLINARRGNRGTILVHSAKRIGCSKATIVRALLPKGQTGVFVDDDPYEHIKDGMQDIKCLERVLFVRSGSKD